MNTKTSLKSEEVLGEGNWKNTVSKLIEEFSNESDINKKTYPFYKINSVLPQPYRVNIPSLITDDFMVVLCGKNQCIKWPRTHSICLD
jgi:hypothetical protein